MRLPMSRYCSAMETRSRISRKKLSAVASIILLTATSGAQATVTENLSLTVTVTNTEPPTPPCGPATPVTFSISWFNTAGPTDDISVIVDADDGGSVNTSVVANWIDGDDGCGIAVVADGTVQATIISTDPEILNAGIQCNATPCSISSLFGDANNEIPLSADIAAGTESGVYNMSVEVSWVPIS